MDEEEARKYRKPMEKARPMPRSIETVPDEFGENDSYFSKWWNREITNLGSFDTALFELFLKADGKNRQRLIDAFPDYFLPK